jgi:hypothetical protein
MPLLALSAGDPSQPGAYCPFPKQGEKPVCFTEVEQEYSDFFAAVDSGRVDDPEVTELERTLTQEDRSEDRSLALSSLAYGYFTLAERAARSDHPDPALIARLESWNELLGAVYVDAENEPAFRTAIREAALDLHARAPAVPVSRDGCDPGEDGQPCQSTSALLATLHRIDELDAGTGVRGALGNLLERILDDDGVDPADDSRP